MLACHTTLTVVRVENDYEREYLDYCLILVCQYYYVNKRGGKKSITKAQTKISKTIPNTLHWMFINISPIAKTYIVAILHLSIDF